MKNPLIRQRMRVVEGRRNLSGGSSDPREVMVDEWRWEVVIPAAIVAVVVLLVVLVAGLKAFGRYQARADAGNRVKVTAINIRSAKQQVLVQNQLANVKAAEAEGIRRAQDTINKTLTALYVQHEAVQAQLAMAKSQNHTIIYVPAGTNGTPVITQSGDPSATPSP